MNPLVWADRASYSTCVIYYASHAGGQHAPPPTEIMICGTPLRLSSFCSLFGFSVVVPRLKHRAKAVVVNLLSYPRVPHIVDQRLPSSLVLYFLLTLRFQRFQHLGRTIDALRGSLVIHDRRRAFYCAASTFRARCSIQK